MGAWEYTCICSRHPQPTPPPAMTHRDRDTEAQASYLQWNNCVVSFKLQTVLVEARLYPAHVFAQHLPGPHPGPLTGSPETSASINHLLKNPHSSSAFRKPTWTLSISGCCSVFQLQISHPHPHFMISPSMCCIISSEIRPEVKQGKERKKRSWTNHSLK